MSKNREAFLTELRGILGSAGLVEDAQEMSPFLADWWGKRQGAALAVARPDTVERVTAVVACCARANVPIVPQGGNTGLCGGATPRPEDANCLVVALGRLNRVRAVDTYNQTITVDAGCTLAAIQAAAQEADRLFPLSLGSEGSCQIGGNISTNAGGTAVLRYGNMRDLVLGIEAVLPDGILWNGLRSLRKDNTGYDLKQLFIGAEGTLGLVTGAVLKLFPRPSSHATAWVALDTLDQAPILLALIRSLCGERITSFEICSRSQLNVVYRNIPDTRDPLDGKGDWVALIELADMAGDAQLQDLLEQAMGRALEEGIAIDAALAISQAQAGAIWRIRHSVSEANVREGYSVSHDISVPIASVGVFVRQAQEGLRELTCVIIQAVIFGAFAQALPDKMPACPSSSVCLLNIKTTDTKGKTIMASVGPVGGGAGGSANGDGSDASGANMAFLRNTPVEINEAEVPVRITEYGLVRDSGGAGQYRGGMAIIMEFKVFAPDSLVTARNRDRTLFGSWGFKGGHSGSTARFIRNPGQSNSESLGNTDLVALAPGDIIRLEGNGGGGYGDPMLRDSTRVETDVRCRANRPPARAHARRAERRARIVHELLKELSEKYPAMNQSVA